MKNKGRFFSFALVCTFMLCSANSGNSQTTQPNPNRGFYPVIGLNMGTTIIGYASGITFGADFSAIPDGFFFQAQFNFTKPFPYFCIKNNSDYLALNMRTTGMQIGTSIHHKNCIYALGAGFRGFDASHFAPLQYNPDLSWTHVRGMAIPLTAQMLWTGERSGIRFSYTVMRHNGQFIHEALISFVACVGN